jgi:hypothetical protein
MSFNQEKRIVLPTYVVASTDPNVVVGPNGSYPNILPVIVHLYTVRTVPRIMLGRIRMAIEIRDPYGYFDSSAVWSTPLVRLD